MPSGRTIPISAALGVLALATYLSVHGCHNPLRVPVIRDKKLISIVKARQNVIFVCPRSFRQYFVNGQVPDGMTNQIPSGTIRVTLGRTNVLTLRFGPGAVADCNWLSRYGLVGHILETPHSGDKFNLGLIPGAEYRVEVDSSSTGWLLWLRCVRASGWDLGLSVD